MNAPTTISPLRDHASTGCAAWVIGGGSGIGETTALALCRAGWQVAVSGRRADALDAVVERAPAGRAFAAPCDVADSEGVDRARRLVAERLGGVHPLVYCAGITVTRRHWADLLPQDARAMVDANLLGVAHAIAAVLPGMRQAQRGSVVVISSWAGWTPTLFTGPVYSATKTALRPLVESVNAEEGRHGIRASLVCPAEVATPILEARPIAPTKADLARMLQPEDVASAVLFALGAPQHMCINEVVVSPVWNRIYTEPHRLTPLAAAPADHSGKPRP